MMDFLETLWVGIAIVVAGVGGILWCAWDHLKDLKEPK